MKFRKSRQRATINDVLIGAWTWVAKSGRQRRALLVVTAAFTVSTSTIARTPLTYVALPLGGGSGDAVPALKLGLQLL